MLFKRIFFNIILAAGVFLFPWWLLALFVTFGVFYFSFYHESLFWGAGFDILYGSVTYSWLAGFGLWGVMTAGILLAVAGWIKRRWRP